ncbi:phosphoribosylaminoimidazolecarboxamide formyltransferase [Fervidobacterium sp. SC_NGM5_O18]|uniref:Phosphoribosylaminoimidazolecarboxamide formyltransferase n=1 Tax=Fervidobacterium pennivorans TaxID=93466 RepID=A0A172T437_FERPE|nr:MULTISPECIES: phosphoribosylaminoimidazolecarboxamide formyltransferase [Fervidobacterium]ANE41741.1 phosphoribosylaminoimidazolecarboxamide formyltransferase [Fervidobacterium pennivorans]MDM7321285.1 phosphoribosylaminoimidazolecarboxamide formyltransferase [Fervidobacterium sp.]NPU89708.1 phosphoribosylaminoimidazolecarboxamide formyltransferase [Fervidobacterium sp.]PHJ12848.1 phosphoribosylaminoimidazolecarboxamide formyltransferase [Fervidobacterium sp. SC_NGM5_O18]
MEFLQVENVKKLELERYDIELRYGENAHERAFIFGQPQFELLHEGKQLSYNNILDAEAAWVLAKNLQTIGGGVAVIKHQTPCGVSYLRNDSAEEKISAVKRAIQADSESSYGGILATSFPFTLDMAKAINIYLEVIVAPDFEPQAVEYLSKKKVRLIKPKEYTPYAGKVAFGSLVLSERKFEGEPELLFGVPCDVKEIKFALIVVESVKSNAIVIVKDGVTAGIGGGQPSRKRSAWIATTLAKDNTKGAIAASDAFFPFTDGLEILIDAGIKCIVAPLGSIRDDEVLNFAREKGITFYKSPIRLFRH